MVHPAQFHPLPLPRGWPRRVRSAVVQVISLARVSLAQTHSWASESLSRELRQNAEEDRLQQTDPEPELGLWGERRRRDLGFGGSNPELRQKAEEDRLQQEVYLRREEIRIKDARKEHIEAAREYDTAFSSNAERYD